MLQSGKVNSNYYYFFKCTLTVHPIILGELNSTSLLRVSWYQIIISTKELHQCVTIISHHQHKKKLLPPAVANKEALAKKPNEKDEG